ncbi:unnamed protein product [Callosobruchus maculatus]|uniref:DUF5641 domain-containing protein n=1 Tax=Callosobruchus maculatus TaxID=64391 RepID=A0A653C6E6_CALMS|nr:unnamed protein product [Callosobruchus maculatus]
MPVKRFKDDDSCSTHSTMSSLQLSLASTSSAPNLVSTPELNISATELTLRESELANFDLKKLLEENIITHSIVMKYGVTKQLDNKRTAKKEKAFRSAISTAKTRKRCTEKKLEGSLEKFLSKPENRETECQENVGVASTSAALNLEVMEVSEERNISPLEADFSKTKTRESTAEEPVSNLSSSISSCLDCGDDPGLWPAIMREHIHRIQASKLDSTRMTHYLGDQIQNEIIDLLGTTIKNYILNKVRESKYFSIILDCTPDVSHTEQITVILRILDQTLTSLKERFEELETFTDVFGFFTNNNLFSYSKDVLMKHCKDLNLKLKDSSNSDTDIDGTTNKPYAFIWREGVAGRGAQEVGSCLKKFIDQHLKNGVEDLILWSDSCGGQNRNIKIVLLLKKILSEHSTLQTICFKYLESGHSFLPNDTDFAQIERALKLQVRIYTIDEFKSVIENSKKKNPFEVIQMNPEDFFSTENIEKQISSRKITIDKCKIYWLKTKVVFVSNRIAEIQRCTTVQQWNHVSSSDNPADLVSRGLNATELNQCDLWWRGPSWLVHDQVDWPKTSVVKVEIPELKPGKRRSNWHSDPNSDHNPIKSGSMVLIIEDNSPPLLWRLGRVIDLHPGTDNKTRVVTVRTANDSSASNIEDSIDIANPKENIQNVGNPMPEEQTEIDFDFFRNKPLDQAQIGAPINNEIAVRWSPKKVKLTPQKEKLHQGNCGDIRDSEKISPVFKLPAHSIQVEVQRTQKGGEVTSGEEEMEPAQGTGASIPSPQVNYSSNQKKKSISRKLKFKGSEKSVSARKDERKRYKNSERNEGTNDQSPNIREGDKVFIKTTGRNKIRKKYTKLKVDKAKGKKIIDSYQKIRVQINKDDIIGHALLLDLGHTVNSIEQELLKFNSIHKRSRRDGIIFISFAHAISAKLEETMNVIEKRLLNARAAIREFKENSDKHMVISRILFVANQLYENVKSLEVSLTLLMQGIPNLGSFSRSELGLIQDHLSKIYTPKALI